MNFYPIFFYSGIVFFIVHLLIYGLGLDQSYFGLLLAYVGYTKPVLSTWILVILCIGLILEGICLGRTIYEKIMGYNKKEKNQEKDKKKKEKKDT